MNIDYQTNALESLRKGLESYDRRHGWRGAITNKLKDSNWQKKLDDFKIDPTLKWEKAEIIKIDDSGLKFKTIKGLTENNISVNSLKWAIGNKQTIFDKFQVGDIIFVSNIK